jgi:hypothetical protein
MKKNNILYLYSSILCCIICISCNSSSEKNENTGDLIVADMQVIVKKEITKTPLNQVFSECRYVPLETTKECLVDYIVNLFLTKEYIIVQTLKECLVFNRDTGKFVRKLGNYGPGPEDYNGVRFTAFDENKGVLFVSDHSGKLLSYDIHSGNFISGISSFDKKREIFRWDIIDSVNYVASIGNVMGVAKDRFRIGNIYGDSIYSYPNHIFFNFETDGTNFVISSYNWMTHFHHFENCLHIKEQLVDTVYRVKDLYTISPYLVFNMGYLKFPQDSRGSAEKIRQIQSDFVIIGDVNETKNYIFSEFSYKNKDYALLYDKQKQKFDVIDIETENNPFWGMENNIIAGFPKFWPKFITNSGEAVDFYSAPDLLNYIEKESKKSSISKELEAIAENVIEDDNHIIVIAK